ncbi:phage tail length tape measure family protein [Terrihabitans sp. B22-R8]|uniref:phage tail length tape measure family protein n=1 Tax=Terrihabitans sp. B22-R8 TaxID=3425128 RepID=UPI00403D0730
MTSLSTIKRLTVEGKTVGLDKVAADLHAVEAAQEGVARAAETTAKVTETSARRQLSASQAYERQRRNLDDTARAQATFERGQNTINRALQQGVIDAEEAARAMRQVEAAYQAAGMRSASAVDQSSLNRLLGVNDNQAGAARASAAAFEDAAREADQLAAKANALRGSLDPVAAAQQRLNAELAEYNSLASAGVISSGELAQANAMAHKRFSAIVDPLDQAGKKTGLAAHEMKNLGFQLNDAVTMLASGSSPFQVMATQGGQVYQSLSSAPGGVGAALKEVAALTVTWIARLSPLIAVTGLVAGGVGLLTRSLNEGRKDALSYGDVMKAVFQTIGDRVSDLFGLGAASKLLDSVLDDISKGFSIVFDNTMRGADRLSIRIAHDFRELPDVFRIAGENAANNFLQGIEALVNGAIDRLNKLLAFMRTIPGLGAAMPSDLGKIEMPKVDIGGAAAADRVAVGRAQMEKDLAATSKTDYAGGWYSDILKNANDNQAEDAKKKAGGAGRQPRASEYERDTERLKEQTAALLDQAKTYDMTEGAATRYTVAQDLLRAAAESGMPITSALTEQINATANAYADAKLKLEGARMEVENRGPFEAMHAELARLEELKNAGAISWDTYANSVVKARATAHGAVAGMASDAVGILGQLFENNKAVAIAEAIVSTYQGVAKALSYYPPPISYAMAAGQLALGMKQVASIRSTTKNSKSASGSVGGGGSAGAGSATPAAPAPEEPKQMTTIVLKGDVYSKQSVEELFRQINDGQKDGYRINVVAA